MFIDFPLRESVARALEQKGFATPTAIQSAALPHALAGGDVLGLARTGTGKTLAFGLPIANRLEPETARGRAPRAFILTPTRELALQVAGELELIAADLRVVTVYGGTGYSKQAADLKRGADIVVATPGRAVDYYKQGLLQLAGVEVVVLDEADEMLNAGFEEDVELLLAATPAERQTMLFSATLPRWAENLAAQHLRDPLRANVVQGESVSYEEIAIEAPLTSRLGILSDVLHVHGQGHTIVFTRTKAEVDDLAKTLSAQGHAAEAVHGDLNQVQRERVLDRFRAGQVTVLVATDVAARGLDIPEVDLVVHYRFPEQMERYQHRSGRTGRAGRAGTVVLLFSPRERRELALLERAISRKLTRAAPPQPEAVQGAKLAGLQRSIAAQTAADKDTWRQVAETWLASGNADALAGLLALTLGGAPAPRSLLTGEEGWVTVELRGRPLSVPQTVRLLKQVGVGDLGRVQSGVSSGYADVRPHEARQLPTDIEDLQVGVAQNVEAAPQFERPRRRPEGNRVRSPRYNR
ncbi:MAG: DEAD-box ATP-dependent RNA helicase DeaD (CshA) [uncultured Truepera sp.]|uniref:DEAD-box ATP-dependent RNA helicase DeaD ( CshA) n=1 Tax=uncultured Truepera sp. TaxID=543023 RepID=A0A6J4VDF8_9DEIN|nr:MAG: DEAD-box ATP-dependent RNA helicase DeaD (CshA) [uncultured Truepera sp.]